MVDETYDLVAKNTIYLGMGKYSYEKEKITRLAMFALGAREALEFFKGIVDDVPALPWGTLFEVGVDPAELRTALKYRPAFFSKWEDHPLHLAGIYEFNGHRDLALEAYAEFCALRHAEVTLRQTKIDKDPYWAGYFCDSYSHYQPHVLCPIAHPQALAPSYTALTPDDDLDCDVPRIFPGWYSTEGIVNHRCMDESDLAVEIAGVMKHPGITQRANGTCKSFVAHTLASPKQHSLYRVAACIQYMGPELTREILRHTLGARECVWALPTWATEAEMVRGLRALAGVSASRMREWLCLMQRAPTIDEVMAVRSSNLVVMLHNMSWEHVCHLATDPDSRSRILGYILRFQDRTDLDTLQNCLSEHPRRVQLAQNATRVEAWYDKAEEAWAARHHAIVTRAKIWQHVDQPGLAILLVLRAAGELSPHLCTLINQSPAGRTLENDESLKPL